MSNQQNHETQNRGELAPSKKRWEEQSEEQEEEAPRKNREVTQRKQPFKPKFVPRQQGGSNKNNYDKGGEQTNKSIKQGTSQKYGDSDNKDYDRGQQKKERQYVRYNDRDNNRRNNRQKKGVGKDIDRTTNSKSQNQKQKENRNDYSVEKKYRKNLPDYKYILEINTYDQQKYYIEEAKKLMNKFSRVLLFGYDDMIGEAFNIAEMICRDVKNLDRINIPSTDVVDLIYHPKKKDLYQRRKTEYVPMIQIELSKQSLLQGHIGYQTYKKKQESQQPPTKPKKEYKEKEQKETQEGDNSKQ